MKKKNVRYVCDHCGKKMKEPIVFTNDVPFEGASQIGCGKKYIDIGDQHFCSIQHLLIWLENELTP